jgi:hypothetical protein
MKASSTVVVCASEVRCRTLSSFTFPAPACVHHIMAACSLFMGNIELPGGATGSKQTIKMPVGTYEFGANLISEKGVSN